ncbi:MAG: nicotinate-nucleotide--dimethylbenzimidazole phosphoribosyltransferase [Oleiphilaceae bacterium]|nr:nicotinate-nucleotide--dimethylbenzimidazole phosphoribosyltransferase [Oleiphilaceae bacterium]
MASFIHITPNRESPSVSDTPFWNQPLPEPDESIRAQAWQQQGQLTKPPGSLGLLESLAVTLAAQQRTLTPSVQRVQISLFAADHGVRDEGISAFPQSVTGQMLANFAGGGAAISVLARQLEARLEVIDMGVRTPPAVPGLINASLGQGSGNIAREPAMSRPVLEQALLAGEQAADRAWKQSTELFIAGEMGIGNTTSATALACALLDARAEKLTGPGTGLDAGGVAHKARVIDLALRRHGPDRDPLGLLQSLGGFEIAAITGALLGCAARGIPVLVDGFIVTVAALAAVRIQLTLRPWLHFAHRSGEPGHGTVLKALQARPLLELDMRLGEASGAAVAVPLLRAACQLHNQMASFEAAGVSNRSDT